MSAFMLATARANSRPRVSCVARRYVTRISSPPRCMLFVSKKRDPMVAEALVSVIKHIRATYPTTRMFHDVDGNSSSPESESAQPGLQGTRDGVTIEPWSSHSNVPVDLVVTLGGDGTILHASSLFRTGPVPPVLSFSMGTLGFLLPFHVHDFREAIQDIYQGRATALDRMRLSCTFYDAQGVEFGSCGSVGWQVMNEITLHRGRSPHLNIVDAYVDGVHLTEAFSDGLIISTPTGSTAYSLSSGGPIVHPSVKALLLTPICPRSLSFRPLLFPGTSQLTLQINSKSRAPAEVSMDGQEPSSRIKSLSPGESVRVQMSPYPIPCIRRSSLPSSEGENGTLDNRSDDWVRDINTLLQFNATFRNKGTLRHSR
ncbi:ATP-NAD kinase-like domain-containing protein [Gautieria morchelliformis]|nr:ATP-NAD kinase-like domain-containing protein [Gautieria morchelliformis]